MKNYSTKDLAVKYHVTEKTVINYINQICINLGLDINDFKRINNRKVEEYFLSEGQEHLFGTLIKYIDRDPYVTKRRSYSNSTLEEIKAHRDKLILEINSYSDEALKKSIMDTDEYRFALEFKEIHDQFEEYKDSILFSLEHLSIEDRLDIEKQILSTTKNLAHNLLVKLTKELESEATTELEAIDEDGLVSMPSEDEIAAKVAELLTKKLSTKKSDLQFNYGGLSLVEKAIAKAIMKTTKK